MKPKLTHSSTLVEYLEKRREIDASTSCWNWTGYVDRDGYGRHVSKWYRLYGKSGTHQLSYLANNGEIPDGLLVCHTCDNRKCMYPEQMFLGTNQDNMTDKMEKGRHVALKGEHSKLFGVENTEETRLRKSRAKIGERFDLYREIANKTRNNHSMKQLKAEYPELDSKILYGIANGTHGIWKFMGDTHEA